MPCSRTQHGLTRVGLEPPTSGSGVRGINHQAIALPYDTNCYVQPRRMARGLNFQIEEVEGLYYLCSKNKGADQQCGYFAADWHLVFHICKKLFLIVDFNGKASVFMAKL